MELDTIVFTSHISFVSQEWCEIHKAGLKLARTISLAPPTCQRERYKVVSCAHDRGM